MDAWTPDKEKHNSDINIYTVQFPLLYHKDFGEDFKFFVGGILNWNCYADYHNSYKVHNTKYNTNTSGLRQRKLTFDAITGIGYNGLGVYFRYAPQSLFQKGYDEMNLDRTWTLGLMIAL